MALFRRPLLSLSLSLSSSLSLRRFASDDLWVPQPRLVGSVLPSPKQFPQLLPEGLSKSMAPLTELSPSPSFLYRQTTDDIITRLSLMKEGGFAEAGTSAATVYVHGDVGVGKSSVLAQVVLWARMNGWLVLFIRDGKEWIEAGERIVPSGLEPGTWNQVCVSGEKGPAMSLLSAALTCHSDLLKRLPLKLRHRDLPANLSSETLFGLVKCGVDSKDEEAAAGVLLAYRHELNLATACPVLVVVDGYSALEGVSPWTDPEEVDFDNVHKKYGRMMASKLALSRMLLLNPDYTHGLINGAFVVSTESASGKKWLREFNASTGRKLAAASSAFEVTPFTPEESASMVQYYAANNMMLGLADSINPTTCSYIHQISGGVPREVLNYSRLLI